MGIIKKIMIYQTSGQNPQLSYNFTVIFLCFYGLRMIWYAWTLRQQNANGATHTMGGRPGTHDYVNNIVRQTINV